MGARGGREIDARSVERTVLLVGLALSAASLYWRSQPLTAGVAVGAAVAWLNFRWLRRIVSGALALAAGGGRRAAGARLAVEFAIKSAALVAVVYYVVRHTRLDPVGLVVGLSSVVVAVLVEFLRTGGQPGAEDASGGSGPGSQV